MNKIIDSLSVSFYMFWEVLWPLVLGFFLSALVQALISHKSMGKYLGGQGAKNITFATLFGMVSSSCSYAAVAIARAIFKKGASFTSAMVFEIASTNLVIELGIILIVLMGWQFAGAEFVGGIVMVILIALIFRLTLTHKLVQEARQQAEKGLIGKMEGHAEMDMSITQGKFLEKLFSKQAITSVSHYFVMDWASVWTDILLGFLISGALSVFVPHSFWQAFFFVNDKTLAFIWGPLVGPIVAALSFVCSVGNVPLAAVLWKGGISFGGVVSFIFADLIVLPILNIYRKYYGVKTTIYIFVTFYLAIVLAGYLVEILFGILGLIPTDRSLSIITQGVSWNYTFFLNSIFIILTIILILRFIRTGGPEMLRMMNKPVHGQVHHH